MTELSKIYGTFLSKISDYSFLKLTPSELDEELLDYYKSASANFYKCKKDLSLSDDEQFVVGDLSQYEIEIIVKFMLVEYMKPVMISSETLKQSLSDKDFKIYSQANQLRELGLLYRTLQKEANKMVTEYTFIGMTDE